MLSFGCRILTAVVSSAYSSRMSPRSRIARSYMPAETPYDTKTISSQHLGHSPNQVTTSDVGHTHELTQGLAHRDTNRFSTLVCPNRRRTTASHPINTCNQRPSIVCPHSWYYTRPTTIATTSMPIPIATTHTTPINSPSNIFLPPSTPAISPSAWYQLNLRHMMSTITITLTWFLTKDTAMLLSIPNKIRAATSHFFSMALAKAPCFHQHSVLPQLRSGRPYQPQQMLSRRQRHMTIQRFQPRHCHPIKTLPTQWTPLPWP